MSFAYSMHAQSSFEYIDHDFKDPRTTSIMVTDSTIYYAQQTQASESGLHFTSIDTAGMIKRILVDPYLYASNSKIESIGSDSIHVLYYNLVDYDISFPLVYHITSYDGVTQINPRLDDIMYYCDDININKKGDRLTVLNPQPFGNSRVHVYNEQDSLIADVTTNSENPFRTILKYSADSLLFYSKTTVALFDIDNSIDTLFTITDEIINVTKGSNNEILILTATEVITFNLSTQVSSMLLQHDLQNVKSINYDSGKIIIHTSLGTEKHLILFDLAINTRDTIFSSTQSYRPVIFQFDDEYLYLNYNGSFFSKRELGSGPDNSDCRNVKIEDAIIFNLSKTLVSIDSISPTIIIKTYNWKYEYEITITNDGNQDIDSLNVFSNNFSFPVFGYNQFLNLTAYQIEAGQSKTFTGTFNHLFASDKISDLTLYIPGADHRLNCYEDNTYVVTEILSAVTDQKNITLTPILYPNPATDFIQIENLATKLPYYIYSTSGELIQTGETQGRIILSSFPAGLYFIKLDDTVLRFVKE